MVQRTTTRRPQRSKNAIDLGRRSVANADLKHIDSADLLRNSSLSYEDGYADGREFGVNGKFIPDYYTEEDRVRYLTGFKAGCRVNTIRKERFGI